MRRFGIGSSCGEVDRSGGRSWRHFRGAQTPIGYGTTSSRRWRGARATLISTQARSRDAQARGLRLREIRQEGATSSSSIGSATHHVARRRCRTPSRPASSSSACRRGRRSPSPRSPRRRSERPGRVRSCSPSPLDLTSGGPARGLHAPPGPNGLLQGRHVPPALLPPHRPLTPRVVSSLPSAHKEFAVDTTAIISED